MYQKGTDIFFLKKFSAFHANLRIMLPFEIKGSYKFIEPLNFLTVWLLGTCVAILMDQSKMTD